MAAGWEVAYNSGGQFVLYYGDINAAVAKVSLHIYSFSDWLSDSRYELRLVDFIF